jgi:hypothetical protein
VRDEAGLVLSGAVVRIKNTWSLRVRSYVTQRDGRYRFVGLDPNADYEIRAYYRGSSSPVERLSKFDPRPEVVIDLTVPVMKRSPLPQRPGRAQASSRKGTDPCLI